MTLSIDLDSVQIRRTHLQDREIDKGIRSAFAENELIHHEFGIDWLRHLASTALAPDEEAYIYSASRSPSDFVALPIRLNKQTKQAHALSTYYSSLYQPLVCSDSVRPLMTKLLRFLREDGKVTHLTISPLSREAPAFSDIQSSLKLSGWKGIHTWNCFANWIHRPQDRSYASYLESRPSRLRNTIARKSRKFHRENRGALKIYSRDIDVPEVTKQYLSVYRQSWKKEEPHAAFIPGLIKLAADKGWLRLGIAYYDNTPVAAQIWIVANQTASIFKLAYHKDYKHLSPGTILTAYMMKYVIEVDGVSCIDYLTGDDAYKGDWMSIRRERLGIAAYNTRTPGGWLRYSAHQLKCMLKKK